MSQLRQIEIKGKRRILVLDMPEGVKDVYLQNVDDFTNPDNDFYIVPNINYTSSNGASHASVLPEKVWSIFCFLNTATEQQVAELVERDLDAYYLEYVDYGNGFNHDNAIDSLKSLLTANGVDLNEWKNPLFLLYESI